MYSASADYYDLIYAPIKDYTAESRRVAEIARAKVPAAQSILDVACGTGRHAHELHRLGFFVDGVDLEPRFVQRAQRRNPNGRFFCQDMVALDLDEKYDVVACLFSSIAYVRTEDRLRATLKRFAAHLAEGGLVIVEPWFQPGEMEDGYVVTHTAETDDVKVCRMSRTMIAGRISRLQFQFLVGDRDGVEHFSEVHELGLFTRSQTEQAFHDAGLDVEYDPEGLTDRGLYMGRSAAT